MTLVALAAAGMLLVPLVTGAAVDDTEICYTVSDSTAELRDSEGPDVLHRILRSDPDPATNETTIGEGTGTYNIEAVALHSETGVLFAADAGTLGTIDVTTGRFTAIGTGIGSGDGSQGTVRFDDVDGLHFDPTSGVLYGSQRERRGDDLLLRIDPATGAAVAGAFDGADYVVVDALPGLSDIDDLAIDPTDGQMYAIANADGRRDHLVRIDKATGAVSDVGRLGVEDMEGLSFAPGGQLIGTTGKVHGEEGIHDLDKATGAASNPRPLDNADDYEGLACFVKAVVPPAPPIATPPPAPPAPENPTPPAPENLERVPLATPDPAPPTIGGIVESRPELPRTGSGSLLALLAGGLFVVGGFGVAAGARARSQS